MSIYKEKTLSTPNFFQRIFGVVPKGNAIIEVNNLLALHQDNLGTLSHERILDIGKKYKVDLKKDNEGDLFELFKKYVRPCLEEGNLSQLKIEAFKHLKELLLLDDKKAHDLINKESEEVFNVKVKTLFQSKQMGDQNWEAIKKYKQDLLISDDSANTIYLNQAGPILNKTLERIAKDKRYTQYEERELNELARSFKIDLTIDNETRLMLDKFRLFHEIDNGNLPVLKSDINLQRLESLHFKTHVTWQEQRKVTTRYNYAGPTLRIKIVKGVYYRAGSLAIKPTTEDVWQNIDAGMLYLTSQRLIFMGAKGNKLIPIKKILDFKPYSNGVDIQKDSGKSPFLKFSQHTDIFAMILSRLMD